MVDACFILVWLCALVFLIPLCLLVVHPLFRRKTWQSRAKAAILSGVGFFAIAAAIRCLHVPAKVQKTLSANPSSAAVIDSAVDVDNSVHIAGLSSEKLGVSSARGQNVAYEATSAAEAYAAPAPARIPESSAVIRC